jgi:hypothetical protein
MSSNLPEENEEKRKKTKIREKKVFLAKPQRDDDEDVSEQTETEFFIRSHILCVCVSACKKD